jgi:competence protein ComEA
MVSKTSHASSARDEGAARRGGRSQPRRDAESVPTGRRINLNTATQAELEALPGVGSAIARRIVEGPPYRSVDDLERVEGIGPKRLEEIRPLVTAE